MAGGKGRIVRAALEFLRKPRRRTGRAVRVRPTGGATVPPGVRRLPSGRYPANYRYAGRVYDGPGWTPELQRRYPNGVRFTDDGFPDFSPYATHRVTMTPNFAGDRADFAAANRLANIRGGTPVDYTWHHHQDTRTMLLIPTEVHEAVRHAGGVAIMRGR